MNNIGSHLDVISFREDPAFFNKIMPDHILQQSQHHGYVGEGSGNVGLLKSMYSKCTQYLFGAPFAQSTASVRGGMEAISLWHCCGVMEAQSALLGLAYHIILLTNPIDSLWGLGQASLLANQVQ
ncbi:hypothetical protein NFI96_000511 [Prochilodus magdalenae]|nr:hypothetical protein NFI96_000511 [Prochilodus magdalenae]